MGLPMINEERLIGLINDSARVAARILVLLLIAALILLSALILKDDMALLKEEAVHLPQGIGSIGATAFSYIILPLTFLFLHAYLLLMLSSLRSKIQPLGKEAKEHHNFLPYPFLGICLPNPPSPVLTQLFFTFLTIALIPLAVLLGITGSFLRYQSGWISGFHIILVVLDSMMILLFYWRSIIYLKLRLVIRRISLCGILLFTAAVVFLVLSAQSPKTDPAEPLTDPTEPLKSWSDYALAYALAPVPFISPNWFDYVCGRPENKIRWGCRYLKLEDEDLFRPLSKEALATEIIKRRPFEGAGGQSGKNTPDEISGKGLQNLNDRQFRFARFEGSKFLDANLKEANLTGADLREANLTEADLTEANLTEADLKWANLTGADLIKANLTGADLKWANLTGADLRWANLTGADLRWANLTGADLTDANLTGADLARANLTKTNLTGAYLWGANLTGAYLLGATLTGADLRWANLTGADLTDANLTGATLTDANLTGAYLLGATLTGADLLGATLTGADLLGATLTGADLRRANLTGADLTEANLTGADLTEANLTGADLTEANLTGALLIWNHLHGADFQGAVLDGSQWIAVVTTNTVVPSFRTDLRIVFLAETETASTESYIDYLDSRLPASIGRWDKQAFLNQLSEKLKVGDEHPGSGLKTPPGTFTSLHEAICKNTWAATGVVRNHIRAAGVIQAIEDSENTSRSGKEISFVLPRRDLPDVTYTLKQQEKWNDLKAHQETTAEWLLEEIDTAQQNKSAFCSGLKDITEEQKKELQVLSKGTR